MESKKKQTPYDGKKAMVIGDHPHAGATVICLGAEATPSGWGMVFKNVNTDEEFFVFNGKLHIKWL